MLSALLLVCDILVLNNFLLREIILLVADFFLFQSICCPQCLTPIRKTIRYHSNISECLRSIDEVKKKMRGQEDDLKKMMKDSRKNFEDKPLTKVI